MGPRLEQAPLVEAICELHFAESVEWPEDLADRVHARVSEQYPTRARRDPSRTPPLDQMKAGDGTAILQVGTRVLVLNQFRPYHGWSEFRTRIRESADHARALGLPDPDSIGLEYINLLTAEADRPLAELLRHPPVFRSDLGLPLAGFFYRQVFLIAAPRGILSYTLGTGEADPQEGILLGLAFERREATAWDQLPHVLDGAHQVISDAFVASLTEAEYNRARGQAP